MPHWPTPEASLLGKPYSTAVNRQSSQGDISPCNAVHRAISQQRSRSVTPSQLWPSRPCHTGLHLRCFCWVDASLQSRDTEVNDSIRHSSAAYSVYNLFPNSMVEVFQHVNQCRSCHIGLYTSAVSAEQITPHRSDQHLIQCCGLS